MTCNRLVLGAALLMIVGAASAATPASAAPSGLPPFCLKRGGPLGPDTYPLACRWSDYQTCLQAAADLNGNCVVNPDFRGQVVSAPGGWRAVYPDGRGDN